MRKGFIAALLSLIFSLLISLGSPLIAQSGFEVNFNFLPIDDGSFPRKLVNYLKQDENGNIWIATNFGLTRFNGYDFNSTLYKEEEESLIYLDYFLEDVDGRFWMIPQPRAPFSDVFISNLQKTEFIHIDDWIGADNFDKLGKITRWELTPDRNIQLTNARGELWEINNDKSIQQISLPEGFKALGIASTTLIYGEYQGTIWLYNRKTERLQFFQEINDWQFSIQAFGENSFFVYKKKEAGENLKRQTQVIYQGELIFSGELKELVFDPVNKLIWGSTFETLKLVAMNTEGQPIYPSTATRGTQPFNYAIFDLMIDQNGLLWMGTTYGVYQVKAYPPRFQRYLDLDVDHQNVQNTYSCRGILKVNEDEIWVNSSRGTMRVNLETSVYSPLPKDLLHQAVDFPILQTKKKDIWLARKHLRRMDRESGEVLERIYAPNRLQIWSLFEDQEETIWIGNSQGISFYNPTRHDSIQQFEQYNGFDELANSLVLHFYQDREGMIWVASSKGLFMMDPQKGVVARYTKQTEGDYYLPSSRIYYIYQDESGIFWLATNGDGLIRLDLRSSKPKIKTFNLDDGLPSNVLYAIFEDENNQLWISSNWGIIQFDKSTFRVQNYLLEHGLSHFEFNRLSFFQDETDGTIYFGGLNGLTRLHPNISSDNGTYEPQLVITSFEQLDISVDSLRDRSDWLFKNDKITIDPDQPFFMLEFGLQDYWKNEEHHFEYQIEGFVDRWTPLKGNTFNMSNLPYGEWDLHVRGRGVDRRFSKNELILPILVHRPFYHTFWFWMSLGLVIAFLIWAYLQDRIRWFRKREEVLEAMVESRTARIQEQAEKLKEMDEAKNRFFTNVAHELRTPLTLIMGPAESLLQKNNLLQEVKKGLLQIYSNTKKLLNRTNDILDLAKLESDSLPIELKATNLYTFCRQVIDTFQHQANLAEVGLAIQFAPAQTVIVQLDREKTVQIIGNLISNAIKFTGKGGQVSLLVSYSEDSIQFEIKDTGIGIPAGDLAFIFDRFYQSTRQTEKSKGTGIGLSLCKELTELMKGAISVKSEMGKGTTFKVLIPRINAEKLEAIPLLPTILPERTIAFNQNGKTPINILLVEDNHEIRQYVKSILQRRFSIKTAEDGIIAWDMLNQAARQDQLPQLVVSDIMMPRMDGFELLEKLKQDDRFRHLPIIMLTARTASKDKLKALRVGVDDYMFKPFLEEELIARVDHLINHYKGRKTNIRPDLKSALSKADLNWLEHVEEVTMKIISSKHFSIRLLTEKLAISERQFQRRIKNVTGLSPNKYIREIRLIKARDLLESGKVETVAEVAYAVGFSTPAYFSEIFKERFGKKPIDFL